MYVPKSKRLEKSNPNLKPYTILGEDDEQGWFKIEYIRITPAGTFIADQQKALCTRPKKIEVAIHNEIIPIEQLVRLWEEHHFIKH